MLTEVSSVTADLFEKLIEKDQFKSDIFVMGDSLWGLSTRKEKTDVKGQGFRCEATEGTEILKSEWRIAEVKKWDAEKKSVCVSVWKFHI